MYSIVVTTSGSGDSGPVVSWGSVGVILGAPAAVCLASWACYIKVASEGGAGQPCCVVTTQEW